MQVTENVPVNPLAVRNFKIYLRVYKDLLVDFSILP